MFFCFLITLFFNIIFESESISIDIEKKSEINLYDGKWVRDSQLRKVDDPADLWVDFLYNIINVNL